jgi:hypothetical protein
MLTSTNRRIQVTLLAGVVAAAVLLAAGAFLTRWPARVAEADPRPVIQQGTPKPVVAEPPAPQWTDAHPLDQLLALARCIERSRGDSVGRAYPRSLAAVERLACAPSTGYDDHHFVYYTPPRGRSDPWRARGFTLEVEAVWDSTDEPVKRDIPATRSYLLSTEGRIHVTSERRRATHADPVLPMCEPGTAGGSDCQPYLPRQRWGVRPQLPGAYVTANRDTVRKGRPLDVSLEFTPLSPIDRLVWYSITWNTNARATTHRLSPREGWPARGVAGIGFRQKHVYADTGQKIIEVVFATTGGERYMRQDTVEVRPR